MFVEREPELEFLRKMHAKSRTMLFPMAILGPRRIGKTALIREFIRGKNAIYIFVNETKSDAALAMEIQSEIKRLEGLDGLVVLDSVEKCLQYLLERSKFDIIVLDEFQNFRFVQKHIFGAFQHLIDSNEDRKKLLVFLGSTASLVREALDDPKAPLFGRMRTTMRLKPLPFAQCSSWIRKGKGLTPDTQARLFFIFGGYPKYYPMIQSSEASDFEGIVSELFFDSDATLQNEVMDLLKYEFGSRGAQYYVIMEAIATGHTKLSEIASYAMLSATTASTFLHDLVYYHELVEPLEPLLRPNTKDRRYRIKIPILRFWFRFVRPHLSSFELGNKEVILKEFRKNFESYAGREFENLCREFLALQAQSGRLAFEKIGPWWHKDLEIDILTLGTENTAYECKWSKIDEKDALRISPKLEETARMAGLSGFKKGLFAKEATQEVYSHFDHVITLDDIIEGKFPHRERRKASV